MEKDDTNGINPLPREKYSERRGAFRTVTSLLCLREFKAAKESKHKIAESKEIKK